MTIQIVTEIGNVQTEVQDLAAGYNNAGFDTAPLKQADEHLEQAKFEVINFDAAVSQPEETVEEPAYSYDEAEELTARTQG